MARTEEEEVETIRKRIEKLEALARHPATGKEEAAVALRQAAQLRARYRIPKLKPPQGVLDALGMSVSVNIGPFRFTLYRRK